MEETTLSLVFGNISMNFSFCCTIFIITFVRNWMAEKSVQNQLITLHVKVERNLPHKNWWERLKLLLIDREEHLIRSISLASHRALIVPNFLSNTINSMDLMYHQNPFQRALELEGIDKNNLLPTRTQESDWVQHIPGPWKVLQESSSSWMPNKCRACNLWGKAW